MGPTPPCRAKWHFVNNDLIYFPFKPFHESLSILAELVHHLNFLSNISQNYIKMLPLKKINIEEKKRRDQVKLIFNFTFLISSLRTKSDQK